MLSGKFFIMLAGACFSLSYIIFADGFVFAKRCELPYNFLMWTPQLLSLCGLFLTFFVNPLAITHANRDEFEESEEMHAKTYFFLSVLAHFGAIALAVYLWIEPYSTHNQSWPGSVLILQCVLLIACSYSLLTSRTFTVEEGEGDNYEEE